MALTRVRKSTEQGTTPPYRQADGLDLCLACWRDYMHTNDRDLRASRMKLVAPCSHEEGDGYESDLYAEQRQADLRVGEATDAMIDSLSRLHVWAIYKACGIGQVWRFPHADFGATLDAARAALETKLRSNLATRARFA